MENYGRINAEALGWGQYPLILVGGAVGIVVELVLGYAAHQSIWAVTTALGFLAAGYIAEKILPRRHAHCDVCERCSLDDGIPARRREVPRTLALLRGGWLVGDSTLCCRGCAPEVLRIWSEMNAAADAADTHSDSEVGR